MDNLKNKIILVVAAHPDDPEFGAGGTLAKYILQGANVYYVICTRGNRGSRHQQIDQDKLAKLRVEEQTRASQITGVKQVFFLDHEDGNLLADVNLKEEVTRFIRKLKPDMIFTHDPSWFYIFREDHAIINHHDHRQTGIATLDAVYPLSRDLASFPEHLDQGLTPHKVLEVCLFSFDNPNFLVDVTETFAIKIKAILAHKSQVDDPRKLRERLGERAAFLGAKIGTKYAEGFMKLLLN